MKTKAVSPIIATVLIVVVAVILVGILLVWGETYIQKNTAEADNAIDTSCNGASITITTCDYNSLGDTLKFVMVNSGKIKFNAENDFSLTLIDSNMDLNNSYTDILDSAELDIGESELVTISDYNGESPIDMEIRTSQCNGLFWSKECS